ncbi:hypothetical protein [Nonomuraea rubra]|uniref:Uncharacterized protein n=1 Tax=Nonomuraea rubra TaxID=46180 RepID=A0A7X0U6T2_9ACTN|nr:hypothetical protein [Nonomuraea rubra]MBB6557218.1 hypothetical protein [Nonomuraea rubra]
MGAVSVLWTSSDGYEAILMSSGMIFLRKVEEMIRIPFLTEDELAKAVAQTRAARAAAETSARGEGSC